MDQRMKTQLLVLIPFLVLYLVVGTIRTVSGSEAPNRSKTRQERPPIAGAGISENLIRHVEEGSLNNVKQDLKLGADVNFLDPKKGKTALMNAAEGGFLKIAEMLLSHGAKVDIKDRYGQTALYLACGNGRSRVARLLLEHGANVDLPNKEGFTPLRIAAQSGYPGTVRLLRKYGADPNVPDQRGNYPANAAELFGHRAIATLLRGHARDMRSPSERALDNVDPSRLNADDPFKSNKAWLNANLIIMTDIGSLSWMKRLMRLRADVNHQSIDKDKQTALMRAAQRGHVKIAKLLLNHGASVDIKDRAGETALFKACDHGRFHAAKLLLENGAHANLANQRGITPLMAAARKGRLKIVLLLAKQGADVNARNHEGKNAADLAVQAGYSSTAGVLKMLGLRGTRGR